MTDASHASGAPDTRSRYGALAETISDAVAEYRDSDNVGVLFDRLRTLAAAAEPDELLAAIAPFREMHEVVIPVYERVVAVRPNDAQAMVVLANSYWLTGRGPDVVGELATRAIGADANNRGAWHLWALSESEPRERMVRWRQVAERFPADQLARAALADNAVSVAGAEGDPDALALAITTYDSLLSESTNAAQRAALQSTLDTLRGWRL